MKKHVFVTLAFACTALVSSCQINLNSAKDKIKKTINTGTNPSSGALSNDEVIKGLKEALSVGTNNSSSSASKQDGYFKNPLLFIPFPPEAKVVKEKLTSIGMGSQVAKFELTLNRAAEEAAKKAAPIFLNAITSMSIGDGFTILKGADTAATHYLKDKTTQELHDQFKPTVIEAIQKVQLTKYWSPLASAYNMIPGVQKQNPDLNEYVTQRAMAGLFTLIANEEKKIRKDPAAQVTDLLKKVFGSKK